MLVVSNRIKTIRYEKGFTQRTLAEKAKLSYGFISDIENGKRIPSLSTLDKIAKALGVKPTDLLDTA